MKNFYILLIFISGGYLTVQLLAWVFFGRVFFQNEGELFEQRQNKIEWQTVFPKDVLSLVIFVFVTALTGLLTLTAGMAGWMSLPLGAVGGVLFNFMINTVFAPLFYRINASAAPTEKELENMNAVVTEDITEDDYGAIRVKHGSREYSFAAATANGRALKKGAKVIVIYCEDSLCFVESEEHLCDVLFEEETSESTSLS